MRRPSLLLGAVPDVEQAVGLESGEQSYNVARVQMAGRQNSQ